MDDLRSLIAGDEPAQATAARTMPSIKKTAGRGDPTKEQIFGRNDLADYIQQAQTDLRDAIPGSEMHQRLTRDIAAAGKAFGQMGGQPQSVQPQAVQAQTIQPQQEAQPSSDPLRELIGGVDAGAPETIGGGRGGQGGPTAAQRNEIQPRNLAQQALQGAFDLRKQAPGFITSALDVVGNIPSAVAGTVGYGAGRLFGLTPEEATASAEKVSGALRNPIGRMTGLSETPEYQNAAPTQINEAIGSMIGKGAEAVGQRYGINPTDIEQGVSAAMMAAPFAKAPISRGVNAVKAALPEYTTQIAGVAPEVAAQGAMGQSVGAAAASNATKMQELMGRASPEIQAAVKEVSKRGPIDEAGLKALENHVNFEEFGMKPTAGEATQNVAKLSEEYNSVKSDPEIALRLQERDPKLIEGFNKIKEEFAPEAHAVTQPERATVALDTLKDKYVNRESNIRTAYQTLEDLNGGVFPVDAKTFSENAITQLKKKNVYGATPKVLLDLLEKYAKEPMDFNGWDSARSVASEEMRKGGNEAKTGYIVRKALEDIPMTGEAATVLKPAANHARSLAKEQKDLLNPKSEKYNAAYTAAASDTRSAAEIALGVPHPASANFFDKHVIGKGASEMQLRRAIDELAGNQAAIDELRAGTIHEAKTKSGIKDDSGSVSQAALNDFINKQMAGKLDVALGAEGAAKLRRLSDVATKSEHVRKGGYANVSKTAIAQTPSPIKSAAKEIGTDLATLALTTSSPMAGAALALSKPFFKKRAEAKALKKLEAEQAAKSQETLAPGAGITYTPLSKIGK